MTTPRDRWLLPRRQTEYPTWDLISEEQLHARREATFLAFASIAVAVITASVLLGAAAAIDLSALLEAPLDAPVTLVVPAGLVPAALALVPIMLACELYGRRRASALVWAGMFATAAALGLARAIDALDGGARFEGALAIAGYWLFALAVAVAVYDGLRVRAPGRRIWLRALLATVLAQLAGAAALAAALYAQAWLDGRDALKPIVGAALGAACFAAAGLVVLLVPLLIATRALTLFLRVARFAAEHDESHPKKPRAVVVDETDLPGNPNTRPFSRSEMSFFSEGEQLEPKPD